MSSAADPVSPSLRPSLSPRRLHPALRDMADLVPACGLPAAPSSFQDVHAALSGAPLTEMAPETPGDRAAALGFALGWIAHGARGLVVWAGSDAFFGETGLPCGAGLAQFGIDPARLILARTKTLQDSLWATEQALTAPLTQVVCAIAPGARAPSLAATRRLLLLAQRNEAQALLLRFEPLSPSAAWARWRIAAAPSVAAARELGPPRFHVRLERVRGAGAGQSWRLEWSLHDRSFRDAERVPLTRPGSRPLDGAVAAPALDRPAEARRRRAG